MTYSQPGKLIGTIRPVTDLTENERTEMCALLSQYFENVSQSTFEGDLAEKEWAVLLCDDASGRIKGFSTLMRLEAEVDREPLVAFYSGDTIIEREYWGAGRTAPWTTFRR